MSVEDYSVNYVVCFYIGPCRTCLKYQDKFKEDPTFFIKKHIEFLNKCPDSNIKLATFIVNDDVSDEIKTEIVNVCKSQYIPIEIAFRKNGGFSYGGYEDIIKKNINEFDYFFLIEDDWMPLNNDFYKPFVKRLTEKVSFVCGLVDHTSEGMGFASISNGLIKAETCKIILNKYNALFYVEKSNEYANAWITQTYFLCNFYQEGYKVVDILDEFCSPYVYNRPHTAEHKVFGDRTKPALIIPIIW